MANLKEYKDLVYKIIGAAMEVHSEMNYGLEEAVYNECLCLELEAKGIHGVPEQKIPVYYKGRPLKKHYRMDIVVDDIVVELKSVKEIIPQHRAQLFNYLRITKKPIGLLINFGQESLQGERYAYIAETNECVLMDKNMNLLYFEDVDWEYNNRYDEEQESKIYDEIYGNSWPQKYSR